MPSVNEWMNTFQSALPPDPRDAISERPSVDYAGSVLDKFNELQAASAGEPDAPPPDQWEIDAVPDRNPADDPVGPNGKRKLISVLLEALGAGLISAGSNDPGATGARIIMDRMARTQRQRELEAAKKDRETERAIRNRERREDQVRADEQSKTQFNQGIAIGSVNAARDDTRYSDEQQTMAYESALRMTTSVLGFAAEDERQRKSFANARDIENMRRKNLITDREEAEMKAMLAGVAQEGVKEAMAMGWSPAEAAKIVGAGLFPDPDNPLTETQSAKFAELSLRLTVNARDRAVQDVQGKILNLRAAQADSDGMLFQDKTDPITGKVVTADQQMLDTLTSSELNLLANETGDKAALNLVAQRTFVADLKKLTSAANGAGSVGEYGEQEKAHAGIVGALQESGASRGEIYEYLTKAAGATPDKASLLLGNYSPEDDVAMPGSGGSATGQAWGALKGAAAPIGDAVGAGLAAAGRYGAKAADAVGAGALAGPAMLARGVTSLAGSPAASPLDTIAEGTVTQQGGKKAALQAVQGMDPKRLRIGGGNTAMHFDGSTWSAIPYVTGDDLRSLFPGQFE